MKKFVKQLAEEIRDVISENPPEIIERRSSIILRSNAEYLHENKIITHGQYIEMIEEINKLYNL